LQKAAKFQWIEECEEFFIHLKAFLAAPPVIQKSDTQKPIVIYLAVSEEAVNAALVQDIEKEDDQFILLAKYYMEKRFAIK